MSTEKAKPFTDKLRDELVGAAKRIQAPKLYRLGGETPHDMPQDVFWDKAKGANIRRGQWVVDNYSDVPVDEIQHDLVMQPSEVDQLDLSSRAIGEEPSTNEEESRRSIAMNRALLRGDWQDVITPRTRKRDKELNKQLKSDPIGTYTGFAEKLRPHYPEFTDKEFEQEFRKALLSAIDGQLFQNNAKLIKLAAEQKSLRLKNIELEDFKKIFGMDEEQPK